jgi:hypothetical protein
MGVPISNLQDFFEIQIQLNNDKTIQSQILKVF